MYWGIYALLAIVAIGISDLFRKLGSNLKDPFFTNLIFQLASVSVAIILFLLFSRKIEQNPKDISFTIIGGILISIFSAISFKALADGPGVSTVIPVLRIGGMMLVVLLGIFILKEKFTPNIFFGLLFSSIGIYLLFINK